MSKLVDKLNQVGRSSAQSLGFRRGVAAADKSMLLIAAVSLDDTSSMVGIDDAIVDSVVGCASNLKEDCQQNVAQLAGDLPWGLWLENYTDEELNQLVGGNVDSLIFDPAGTTASLLQQEGIGKVMQVDLGERGEVLAAIKNMSVDAVLIDIEGKEQVSVHQLMHCERLVNLALRPLMVTTAAELTEGSIRGLWESGVSGVVVRGNGKDLKRKLVSMRGIIKNLPATRERKIGKGQASLPRSEQEDNESR